jgi:2-methylcitrate dehydratase
MAMIPSVHATDPGDEVAALIAGYTVNVSEQLEPSMQRAAKAALIDSIAVAMGALTHPAAQAVRRHAYRFAAAGGAV